MQTPAQLQLHPLLHGPLPRGRREAHPLDRHRRHQGPFRGGGQGEETVSRAHRPAYQAWR